MADAHVTPATGHVFLPCLAAPPAISSAHHHQGDPSASASAGGGAWLAGVMLGKYTPDVGTSGMYVGHQVLLL